MVGQRICNLRIEAGYGLVEFSDEIGMNYIMATAGSANIEEFG